MGGKGIFFRFLALLLCCCATVLYAGSGTGRITGQVLSDATGSKSAAQVLEELQAGGGETYDASRFFPYRKGQRVWFLLNVPPSQPTEQYLTIDQTDIPSAEEYAIEPHAPLRTRSGSLYRVADWWVPHTQVAFEMAAGQSRILLAVEPDMGMHFAWYSLNREAFEFQRRWYLLATGMYVGFVLFLIGMAVYNGLRLRDFTYAVYVLFVLQTATAVISIVGIGGFYLWQQQQWMNWYLPKSLPVLAGSMMGAFLLMLVYHSIRPWLRGLFFVSIAIGFVLAAMYGLVGQQPTMWYAIAYFAFAGGLYLPVSLWYGWHYARYIWWVAAGMTCLFAGSSTIILRNLDFAPVWLDAQLVTHMASSLELILIFVGLHVRTENRRDQIVREAALGNQDPTTGTFNEKIGLTRLDLSLDYAMRNDRSLVVALVRSSNYGNLVSEYGTQVAAVSSVHAAACLKAICEEGDILATMNNRDFLLVFKEEYTEPQLRNILSRVIAAGLRESESLPPHKTLAFHAAFSLDAKIHHSDKTLLQRLTGELDAIQQDQSGKTIRCVDNDVGTSAVSEFSNEHSAHIST